MEELQFGPPVPDGLASPRRVPRGEEEVIEERLLEELSEGSETSEEEDLLDRMGSAMLGGFNSVMQSMKRAAVSEETETMLGDVMSIANTLLKSDYNSAQILAAVRILSGFRSNRPSLTNIPSADIRVRYWCRAFCFAEVACRC
jgi:hypothetical protein